MESLRGYKVFVLDTEKKTQNKYVALSVRAAFAQLPEVEAATLGTLGTAVRDFVDGGYDIFVALGTAGSQAPLLARLCSLARFSALWTTEDPYELAVNVEFSDCFDIVFTNDQSSLPAYGGRAHHLPLAASELFNNFTVLSHDDSYHYDLLFVGTAWPNRVATLNEILQHFKSKIRAKIALPYNAFLRPPQLLDPNLIVDWRCSNIDFARLANVSRIVLSLPRKFSSAADHQASGSTPPPRLFEVALAGGFQVFVSESGEAKSYFEDGKEFDFCQDGRDAIRAIEEALADPLARMGKAQAARARALAEHCYRHRVTEIMKVATPLLAAKSEPAPRVTHKTLLIVTHNLLGSRPGGGIEIYQAQLTQLPASYRILYLTATWTGEDNVLHVTGDGQDKTYSVRASSGKYDLTNAEFETVFERILYECRVDIIHFQHLLGYPLSLPLIARACGVPCVWTLHDFYLVCHRYNLLNFETRFCDIAHKSLEHCDVCLNAEFGAQKGAQTRRRNFIAEVVKAFDVILTSTKGSRDYLRTLYPEIDADQIEVVEMLMPNASSKSLREQHRIKTKLSSPLRVAIPGNFTVEKGADYLLRLFNITRNEDIQYSVLGRVDQPFERMLQELKLDHVSIHHGYKQEQVRAILEKFDVSLHVSLWPETYMISLSEAWAAGLIPIVTDLGAQSERVSEGVNGFKVPPHDAAAIARCLRRIRLDEVPIANILGVIADQHIFTTQDHLKALHGVYQRLIKQYPIPHLEYWLRYRQRFAMTSFDTGIRVNAPHWDQTGLAWDQPLLPPASVPSTAQPASHSVLLDDIPGKYAHLTRRVMAAGADGLLFRVDEATIDGQKVDPMTTQLNVVGTAQLIGWMHINHSHHVESYLRLRNGSINVMISVATNIRHDLVDVLNDVTADRAGFDARIDLSQFPNGLYEVSFVAVFHGFIVEILNLLRLLVCRAAINESGACQVADGSANMSHLPERQNEDCSPRPYHADRISDHEVFANAAENIGAEVKWPAMHINDLRTKYAHLLMHLSTDEFPGVRIEIDSIEVDDEPQEATVRQFVAECSIRIAGWMHVEQSQHIEYYFRIKSASEDFVVPISTRVRVDVAEALNDETAETAGFAGGLNTSWLAAGQYELAVVGIFCEFMVEVPSLIHIEVREPVALTTRHLEHWAESNAGAPVAK